MESKISEGQYYSGFKLLKHLDRLSMWEKEGFTYPILTHIDLTNKCNNRCPLCSTFSENDNATIEFDVAKDIISQLKEVDVKAILLTGGGDPTCHPNLEEIIKLVKENDMEIAINTNGYELSESLIKTIVDSCTWIRISLDADGPKIYKKTHGMNEKAFYQVIDNISKLTKYKKDSGRDMVIGIGYLVGSYSIEGIYNAAKLSKELGANNIRIRPFLTWRGKKNMISPEKEKDIFIELEKCKELEDKHFSVSPSKYYHEPVSLKKRKRNFEECYFHHFMTSVAADLKIYACCFLKDIDRYCMGDLSKKSFKEIWLSPERKKFHEKISFEDCPNPCLPEKNAELLWNIKHNELRGGMKFSELLYATQIQIPHSNFL